MLILKILLLLAILGWTARRSFVKDPNPNSDFGFRLNVKRLIPGVVVLFAFFLFEGSIGQVGAGERGVVTRFGAVTGRILGEGIYVVTPFAENVEIMDVQVHAHPVPATGASKDLQNVTTEVTVNYALLPDGVAEVYRDLRREYVERVLAPSVQESVKASTAQFKAEELITMRPAVKDMIQQVLTMRVASHGIRVDAVSVTDFQFSPEFNEAIERKVTAEQNALTAKNVLETKKFEAEQIVVTAKADAEKIRIQAESISQQGGEAYVQMKWVEKWDGHLPQVTTGEGSGMLLQVGAR